MNTNQQKFLFHVAREFITASLEFYYSPNSHNYGRLRGKYLQLSLVELPIRAQDEAASIADEAEAMRNGQVPVQASAFEALVYSFAAYVNTMLTEKL